jgi:hypothetical protein
MATFSKLLHDRVLIKVGVVLKPRQFPERKLYAFPDCWDWMRNEVPKLKTGTLQSAFTPLEQQIHRLRQWISGAPITYDRMFHEILPHERGVWELKTADLRYFGWMYRTREFVVARCGYADDFKGDTKKKTVADERDQVVARREALPLDGEKWKDGTFDELV